MLERSKEYYGNNKDKEKNIYWKEDKLNEYRRTWYYKLDEEKENKIRKDARNRYYAVKLC